MRLFGKRSLSFLSDRLKMAIALCTKNVLTSLQNALLIKTNQKEVILNVFMIAGKRTRKTGAFLGRNLPFLLRLGVLPQTEAGTTSLIYVSVER